MLAVLLPLLCLSHLGGKAALAVSQQSLSYMVWNVCTYTGCMGSMIVQGTPVSRCRQSSNL